MVSYYIFIFVVSSSIILFLLCTQVSLANLNLISWLNKVLSIYWRPILILRGAATKKNKIKINAWQTLEFREWSSKAVENPAVIGIILEVGLCGTPAPSELLDPHLHHKPTASLTSSDCLLPHWNWKHRLRKREDTILVAAYVSVCLPVCTVDIVSGLPDRQTHTGGQSDHRNSSRRTVRGRKVWF